MKQRCFIAVLVMLVALPAFSEQLLKKELKVKEGQKLTVNLKTGGAITITGWSRDIASVEVTGDKKYDDWEIECKPTSEGIYLSSKYGSSRGRQNGGVDVVVQVPEKFDLDLKTMGGGITIEKVEGSITGRTMGGGLKLKALKGSIEFTTMGGSISLLDSDIDGMVKTMGGRVLVENVVGDIEGKSMGGSVVYKNVKSRSGTTTGDVIKISTMGGSINVEDASEGADVHTMGGKIHVHSAKKFVKAKTMGGDITIDQVDGWVTATTMGGEVTVTMVGDAGKGKRDVTLTSMGGDITLTVPEGLSMTLDLELAYTKNSTRTYRIKSDFNVDISETKEWDDSKGSPRKYIYGKGTAGDGGNLVKIRTINGNIYLKKSK